MKVPSISLFALLCFIAFLTSTSGLMSSSIVAMYSQDYIRASSVEIGFIVSAFFFTSALLKLVTGLFLHIAQAKTVLVASTLIIAASLFGYSFASDFLSMALIRIFNGLGDALFVISAFTFLSLISSATRRDEAIGRYTLTFALGMTSGPAISTFCVATFGMRGTFLFASMLAFIGVSLAVSLVRKAPFNSTDFRSREQAFAMVRQVLSNRVFESSLFAYFAISFAFAVMLAYVPIYVRETFNFPNEQVTLLFFGYYLVMSAVRFSIGKLLRFLGKKRILIFGLLNAIGMLWLMSISPSPIFFAVAFSLLGLSMGVVFPIGAMRVVDTVGQNELVLASSFYLLGWDSGCTISPILLSFIVASFGVPYALAAAALPLLAAVVITSVA